MAWLCVTSAAAQPASDAPFQVEETGRSPDRPATAEEQAYDSRIRTSAAAARAFLGALDGGWTLSSEGRDLYVLQLSDRDGVLEGAWRDPRRPGSPEATGFIDVAERRDGSLVLSFTGAFAVLRLVDGRWSGQLTEGERTARVALIRRVP